MDKEGEINRTHIKPTNPLQILPMTRPHLIFQHRQQIRNHIQPLRQQPHPLIHFEIAAHGNIHRLQLRFGPHQFGRVEHRTLQMDVDPQNEKLAYLHGDLSACQGDGPCERYLFRKGAGQGYCGGYEIFEEGRLEREG